MFNNKVCSNTFFDVINSHYQNKIKSRVINDSRAIDNPYLRSPSVRKPDFIPALKKWEIVIISKTNICFFLKKIFESHKKMIISQLY